MAMEISRFQCLAVMAREGEGRQRPGLVPEYGGSLVFFHLACLPPLDACDPGDDEDRQEKKSALQESFRGEISRTVYQSKCHVSPAPRWRSGVR